jgi:hypothetical protein
MADKFPTFLQEPGFNLLTIGLLLLIGSIYWQTNTHLFELIMGDFFMLLIKKLAKVLLLSDDWLSARSYLHVHAIDMDKPHCFP